MTDKPSNNEYEAGRLIRDDLTIAEIREICDRYNVRAVFDSELNISFVDRHAELMRHAVKKLVNP